MAKEIEQYVNSWHWCRAFGRTRLQRVRIGARSGEVAVFDTVTGTYKTDELSEAQIKGVHEALKKIGRWLPFMRKEPV